MNTDDNAEFTNNVDILICIDVQSILNKLNKNKLSLSQDYKKPTKIDDNFFYYITTESQEYSPEKNSTNSLKVTGKVGDIVRWQSSSISAQFNYKVFLYRLDKKDTNDCISQPMTIYTLTNVVVPKLKKALTPLEGDMIELSPAPLLDFFYEKRHIYYQKSTLRKPGIVQYAWYISIYDHLNKLVGYCNHTPLTSIVISDD
ncbi:AidA/PixA family protein [Photorhabdus luminescens]|uniref:AidA/PixA family protein n=1 Tax=Photorhabdus luminescens TaxID=29488 RepID=UPI00223FB38F|nr:AidA/PixA family protein [Photorhabdus luminescens]MCW7763659.1 inclusion body family protein [Photorhabdus luminescens subsp. venezuelensis]